MWEREKEGAAWHNHAVEIRIDEENQMPRRLPPKHLSPIFSLRSLFFIGQAG